MQLHIPSDKDSKFAFLIVIKSFSNNSEVNPPIEDVINKVTVERAF